MFHGFQDVIQPDVLSYFDENKGKRQDLIITMVSRNDSGKFAGDLFKALGDKAIRANISPLQYYVVANLRLDEVKKFVLTDKRVRAVSRNRTVSIA
jgi:hypothetical protein